MSKGVMVAIVLAVFAGSRPGAQWAAPRATVVFADKTAVRVEVADTPAVRQRGLMFRQSLAQDEGMVFVFDQPGSYPFWMQNCLIALDIIWLDADARVVSIGHSLPPCRLTNCAPPCNSSDCPTYPHEGRALYVVEVASGFAKQHGVKVGDRIVLQGVKKGM